MPQVLGYIETDAPSTSAVMAFSALHAGTRLAWHVGGACLMIFMSGNCRLDPGAGSVVSRKRVLCTGAQLSAPAMWVPCHQGGPLLGAIAPHAA